MASPIELSRTSDPLSKDQASLPTGHGSIPCQSFTRYQPQDHRDRSINPFVAGSTLVLVSCIAVALLASSGSESDPLNLAGLLTIIVLAAVRLTSAVWPLVRPAKATFYLFVLLWFGLAGFAEASSAVFPGGAEYSNNQIGRVVVIVILGCVFFDLGYGSNRFLSRSLAPQSLRSEKQRSFAKLGAATSVCSLAIWQALGGFALTLGDRVESARSFAEIGGDSKAMAGILVSLMRVPVGYFLVLGIVLLRRGQFTAGRERATLALLVLVNLLVSSPLSTPRQWIGGLAVAGGLALTARPSQRRTLLLGLVPAIVLIFPLANVFRNDISASTPIEFATPADVFTTRFDFDVFATTIDATTAVDEIGLSQGRQAMGAALFFVPRSYWSEKPLYSGAILYDHSPTNRSPHDNMSVSLWAEGYLDFGYVGVALYLGIYGCAAGALDRRVRVPSEASSSVLATTYVLCGLSFIVLRGSLLSVAAVLASIGALQVTLSIAGSTSGKGECR